MLRSLDALCRPLRAAARGRLCCIHAPYMCSAPALPRPCQPAPTSLLSLRGLRAGAASLHTAAASQPARRSPLATRAASSDASMALCKPEPGTVKEYAFHVFLRYNCTAPPQQQGQRASTATYDAWPSHVEREAPFVEAFDAISAARRRPDCSDLGVVKVTAYEDDGEPLGEGAVDMVIYPDGVRYRALQPGDVATLLSIHLSGEADGADGADGAADAANARKLLAGQEPLDGVQLYVCCHGSRDARCSAVGPGLVARLRRGVARLGLADAVAVHGCSHVGGHKYAGNVVVYGAVHPCDGDWFGGVCAANADSFLDALAGMDFGADGGVGDPFLRRLWRGRMGFTREEQARMFESGGLLVHEDSDGEESGDEGGNWGDTSSGEEEGEGGGQGEAGQELAPPPRR